MKLKKNEVLVLKRCIKDNFAHNGFQYPESGIVEDANFINDTQCGNGLHGWTDGFDKYADANLCGNFIVIKVNKKNGYVELSDKVKFKKGKVVLNTPNAEEAHKLMLSVYPNMYLHWSTANQGDFSTANQGDRSTANQGDRSTARQGDWSTATQGDWSTATQGYGSTATQGYRSTARQGDSSTATQGDSSTARQGDGSTARQGDFSTANQGYGSTARQGDFSTANQGYGSTANQGYSSTANQGHSSIANQGHSSTANQGYSSTATQGHSSTANQGDRSTANQGYSSTATQGDWSMATQGDRSIAKCCGSNYIYRGGNLSSCILFYNNNKKEFTGMTANETIKIVDGDIVGRYTVTPDNIEELKYWEIFVFGSNLNGNHVGGAARLAKDKFGAIDGLGEGIMNKSYAFPTLDKDMNRVSQEEFKLSIKKLIKCAYANTTKIFLVTKVGCGIAGFEEEEVKGYFSEFKKELPANIILPWII